MLQQVDERRCQILVAQQSGQPHRCYHADRHRLTVGEVGVIAQLFRRVADGVAKVQYHAKSGVVLVDGNYIALDLYALVNDIFNIRLVVRLRNHRQDFPVGNVAVLDDFGHAVRKCAVRQGSEHVRVDEDEPRLIERADEVFALGQINAGLAADRGIHLREQRGRDLAQRHTAQEGRRRKAGDVADNTAAERDDQILAGHAGGQQIMVNTFDRGKLLVLLTGGNDRVRHRQGELLFQLLEIQRRYR